MKIFLSYCHEDTPAVEQVAGDLRAAGHDVWQDSGRLLAGQAWSRQIETAIRGCDAFVAFTSPASLASQWVAKEALLALDLEKRVVPVRLDQAEMPVHLYDLQYVECDRPSDLSGRILDELRGVNAASRPRPSTRARTTRWIPILAVPGVAVLGVVVWAARFEAKVAGASPPDAAAASAPDAAAANADLGTFDTKFWKSEGAVVEDDARTGGKKAIERGWYCIFHNVRLSDADVGKELVAKVTQTRIDVAPAYRELTLVIYRSLTGRWTAPSTDPSTGIPVSQVNTLTKPIEAILLGRGRGSPVRARIEVAGDYVVCLAMPFLTFYDNEPGFTYAAYSVAVE